MICPYYDEKGGGLCLAGLFIDSPFCRGHNCYYKMPEKDVEKVREIRGTNLFYGDVECID